MEIRDISDRTINIAKTFDEYEVFKSALDCLVHNKPELVLNWTSSMNDISRKELDNLLHTRRITIKDSQIQNTVPRRIIKIKR